MKNIKNAKISFFEIESIKSAEDLLSKIYSNIESIDLPIDINHIISNIENINLSTDLDIDNLDTAGFIHVDRSAANKVENIRIWTNPLEPETRQRFTKAHELGHLVFDIFPSLNDGAFNEKFTERLHRKTEDNSSYIEQRANRFAAQLLMPAALIQREINSLVEEYKSQNKKTSLDNIISILAKTFATSKDAMRFRLKNLNLI